MGYLHYLMYGVYCPKGEVRSRSGKEHFHMATNFYIYIYFFKKGKLEISKNMMVFFLFVCFLSFFDSCLYEKKLGGLRGQCVFWG